MVSFDVEETVDMRSDELEDEHDIVPFVKVEFLVLGYGTGDVSFFLGFFVYFIEIGTCSLDNLIFVGHLLLFLVEQVSFNFHLALIKLLVILYVNF